MDLQYIGQTVFKSLNKKKHAIFFLPAAQSIHRRAADLSSSLCFRHGNRRCLCRRTGVKRHRWGSLCFTTMLLTVLPELKRMEKKRNPFLPAVFVFRHTAFISYASSYPPALSPSQASAPEMSWLASSASTALCSSISFG